MLDPENLTGPQLSDAAMLLKERAQIAMRPFNEIAEDEARATLDRAFLIDILGLPAGLCADNGPLTLLRRKLAAEPSVSGLKKSATV